MIRVGVIGRGAAGRFLHAPLIGATPGLALVGMGGTAAARDMIDDSAIDLLVIATPDHSHFDLAAAALRAGKHVVVEKPFVTSSADGERLIALAARSRRALVPFHNRRWDGDFLTVREVCADRRLGTITLFEACWDRFLPGVPETWRKQPGPGGGTLWNLGPHLIDQMLLLFGAPEAIRADIVTQRTGAAVDDYFELTCLYGAMRAILAASNVVAAARPRFAVHGSDASFVRFGLDAQEDELRSGADPAATGFGDNSAQPALLTSASGVEAVPTWAGRYLSFYEGVVATVDDGAAPPIDSTEALAGVRLIEAARRSSETGALVRIG